MAAPLSREAPDAILTRDEVAAWLRVRPRQVERLGIPCIALGHRTKRYLASDVRAWLEQRRNGGAESDLREGAEVTKAGK